MFCNIGIWADDSDNEDEKRPSFQNRRVPKNYNAPIDFVAGGVQQAGKKNKNAEVKNEECSDDEKPSTSFKIRDSSEESEDDQPRAGKGCSSAPGTALLFKNKTH